VSTVTALPFDAWLHSLTPDNQRWMRDLVRYSEDTGEDLNVTLAKAALDRHAATSEMAEYTEHLRNSVARLGKELRDARKAA